MPIIESHEKLKIIWHNHWFNDSRFHIEACVCPLQLIKLFLLRKLSTSKWKDLSSVFEHTNNWSWGNHGSYCATTNRSGSWIEFFSKTCWETGLRQLSLEIGSNRRSSKRGELELFQLGAAINEQTQLKRAIKKFNTTFSSTFSFPTAQTLFNISCSFISQKVVWDSSTICRHLSRTHTRTHTHTLYSLYVWMCVCLSMGVRVRTAVCVCVAITHSPSVSIALTIPPFFLFFEKTGNFLSRKRLSPEHNGDLFSKRPWRRRRRWRWKKFHLRFFSFPKKWNYRKKKMYFHRDVVEW